jgi:hypothetical protein
VFLLIKRNGTMVAESLREARIATTYILLTTRWVWVRPVFQLVNSIFVVRMTTSECSLGHSSRVWLSWKG